MKENLNWYGRRYNGNATQRADTERVLSMPQGAIRNHNRAATGTLVLMGGTDEALDAACESNN